MTDAAFWNKAARKYARDPIKNIENYEETLRVTRGYLSPNDRVLEVGCGTGGSARKLAGAVAQIIATDLSSEMIEIARERHEPGLNIDYRVASSDEHQPDAPFDAILGFNLLHLVPDLAGTLDALRAQLKPDGLLITKSVPLRDMNLAIRLMIPAMQWVGKAPGIQWFNRHELARAIKKAGFTLVEHRHFGTAQNSRFIVARRT